MEVQSKMNQAIGSFTIKNFQVEVMKAFLLKTIIRFLTKITQSVTRVIVQDWRLLSNNVEDLNDHRVVKIWGYFNLVNDYDIKHEIWNCGVNQRMKLHQDDDVQLKLLDPGVKTKGTKNSKRGNIVKQVEVVYCVIYNGNHQFNSNCELYQGVMMECSIEVTCRLLEEPRAKIRRSANSSDTEILQVYLIYWEKLYRSNNHNGENNDACQCEVMNRVMVSENVVFEDISTEREDEFTVEVISIVEKTRKMYNKPSVIGQSNIFIDERDRLADSDVKRIYEDYCTQGIDYIIWEDSRVSNHDNAISRKGIAV